MKEGGTKGTREQRDSLTREVNKRGREKGANCLKTVEKREPKSLPAPFLMFILSGMAGVPGARLLWSILTGCVACLEIRQ